MYVPIPNSAFRELLIEALELSRSLMSSHNDSELTLKKQERLRQIRADLKEFAHPICQDRLPIDRIPLTVRDAFVRASVLVTRYSQIGGQKWQGNLSSLTLSQYQTDPIPNALHSRLALNRLCQMFELPDRSQLAVANTLQIVDRQIERQKHIIQAVLKSVDTDGNSGYFALFHHLFGNIPIPAVAINCIHTDTQIYFCVDYDEEQLSDDFLWLGLSAAEQSEVQAFLRSLDRFQFEQFQRFPTFSAWNVENINSEWCDRLGELTGFDTAEILQALIRSVNIIPTRKAESFLVHDIWGHHWQLMLTQFESDYAILSTCDRSLRSTENAYTPHGIITCGELFKHQGHNVEVDIERSRIFFHAEVQQRLGLVFTHLIGEIVADVAEFKFIWDNPQSVDNMPSSSIFKTEPTKLDLSLGDIDFLFLRVLRPLLEFSLSVFSESDLEKDLLAEWLPESQNSSLELRINLKQAIAHLYQIFFQEYNSTYLPTMTGDIGVFAQAVSNLLYLQNAIDSIYKDFMAESNPTLPFQDLLIIFIGNYSSSDRYSEFWEIDNILASYFLPCWQVLSEFERS
jgi:hypothetical protein